MNLKSSLFSLIAATALVGCGVGSGVTLSARAGKPAASGNTVKQAVVVADGIEVTRVRMVVRDIQFEREGTTEQAGVEVSVGRPHLLDLSGAALDGGVTEVFEAGVPTGRYDEVEFEIHRLEDADRDLPEFADMVAKDASILINGTIDGAEFEFASRINEKQELEAPIEIVEGPNNVTLNIDPTTWFKDAAGNRLDPRDEEARSAIEENFKNSIDAFEDDDSNGDDDSDDDSNTGDDSGRDPYQDL